MQSAHQPSLVGRENRSLALHSTKTPVARKRLGFPLKKVSPITELANAFLVNLHHPVWWEAWSTHFINEIVPESLINFQGHQGGKG